jgi:hypothetical protein
MFFQLIEGEINTVIRKLSIIVSIFGVSLILISWGSVGHYKISYNASISFNTEMNEFNSWTSYLADHASDADKRKSTDYSEGIKHYIDIDNYSDFINNGAIVQDLAAAVAKYSLSTIEDNGTLPWATIAAFDSLKNCLKRGDITKAQQFAADLGHYVGDGHMPLHLTKNFNGQLTGNTGIHTNPGSYESILINNNNSLITYSGDTNLNIISDVNQYIFNYIYLNYKFKDSVLIADTYARTFGNIGSSAYNTVFWNETKGFTIKLFKNASHALAELIYTAWVQAGRPSLTATSVEQNTQYTEALEQNFPNPFTNYTSITYNLNENANVLLQVKDILGNDITTLYKGFQTAGSYSISWTPQNQHEGIYFVVLDTKKMHQVKKMLLVK